MRHLAARTFFTPEQKKAIDAAVSEAEKGTTGEIVPVLASSAGDYTHGLYHAAISAAIMGTIGVLGVHFLLLPVLDKDAWDVPIHVLLPVQVVSLVLGYHLARLSPRFRLSFLPRRLLQHRVEHAARRAFRDLGVKKTKDGTGIMLYVSLFERIALVLADRGIASKCPKETWDGVRDLLLKGMKQDDPARGFTQAIAECGRILSKDFPAKGENANELPNELRILA
jgi:putative membrane protein